MYHGLYWRRAGIVLNKVGKNVFGERDWSYSIRMNSTGFALPIVLYVLHLAQCIELAPFCCLWSLIFCAFCLIYATAHR